MEKTAINPWPWSLNLGYNQAEQVRGAQRQLFCAGQAAMDAGGNLLHAGDIRAQTGMALDNLEEVLTTAEMGLGHIVQLRIYTTDVDEMLTCFDILGARFGAVNAAPPMTLIGVTRLALPEMRVEIEAVACA